MEVILLNRLYGIESLIFGPYSLRKMDEIPAVKFQYPPTRSEQQGHDRRIFLLPQAFLLPMMITFGLRQLFGGINDRKTPQGRTDNRPLFLRAKPADASSGTSIKGAAG
jgi:hypothetical protein